MMRFLILTCILWLAAGCMRLDQEQPDIAVCVSAASVEEHAMIAAAERNDYKTVFQWLDSGVNPFVCSPFYKQNLLHLAAIYNNRTLARRVLKSAPSLISGRDRYGLTPLHQAACTADSLLICDYLAVGADREYPDFKDGYTAFHYAVMSDRPDALSGLLSGGMKKYVNGLWIPDRFGRSSVYLSAAFNKVEPLRLLIQSDIVFPDTEYQLALHIAAEKNDPLISDLLLCYGEALSKRQGKEGYADIRNSSKKTALMYAARHVDSVILAQLMTHGASVFAADSEGRTPLHTAVQGHSIKCTEQLLRAGANVNARMAEGQTPLSFAAQEGVMEILNTLIVYRADLNAVDSMGRTPLIMAAKSRFTDIAKRLVEAGADIQIADRSGMNAAMYAAENFSPSIVRFLLQNGININQKDLKGRYIQDIAREVKNDEVSRMIDSFQF